MTTYNTFRIEFTTRGWLAQRLVRLAIWVLRAADRCGDVRVEAQIP